MIWLHGLLLLLLAFVRLVDLRTRHMPNEWIMTGLCLSTLWIRVQVQPSSMMIWATDAPSVVALTLLEQWA
ncbi:MAG: hypothetical protein ACYDCF_00115 [Burkholderiales bacterium]